MRNMSLVVQCFAKLDTLENLISSLTRCVGLEAIDLIFWVDSFEGVQKMERFQEKNIKTKELVFTLQNSFSSHFRSIEVYQNIRNLGPCKTCESAMNVAFGRNDFAIFVEDDVEFARDALVWFNRMRDSAAFNSEKVWAVSGESIFFNAREETLPDHWKDKMARLALNENLSHSYVLHNFVPSTCFATSAEKWRQFGNTRGQILGDVDLCDRCKEEDKWTLFPVVPRIRDVGMLHQDGYSVFIHTAAGVAEIKNTYLMSDDLGVDKQVDMHEFAPYEGNQGRLYTLSTLLKDAT